MKLTCPTCGETFHLNFEDTIPEQDYQWHEDEFSCQTCGRSFKARFELVNIWDIGKIEEEEND